MERRLLSSPSSGRGPEDPDDHGLTILGVVNVLLRQRGLIIVCVTLLAAVAIAFSLLQPRRYRATVLFHPFEQRQNAGLTGLASQLGLSVPTLDASRSPAFYAELIQSAAILRPVVNAAYSTEGANGSLIDSYQVQGATEAIREAKAIRRLRRRLDVVVAARTGIVTVQVDDPSPKRAQAILANILDEVNQFNAESTRERTSAEREFSEQRVEEARTQLVALESALRDFYTQNRAWEGSPDLVFQHGQLQRELALAQQLYAALAQGYEQARIDEIRNVPAISIVEPPREPAEPLGRQLIVRTIGAILLGGSLGVLLAFLREYLRGSAASGDTEYEELREHMRGLPRKLLRP